MFWAMLALLACGGNKEKADKGSVQTVLPDEITEVRAIQLNYVEFNHELLANGTVSARNRADLRFKVQENITAIFVKNNARVVKGQKIAELDRFKLQNDLNQAKDRLVQAQLDLQDVLIGQGYALADSTKIPTAVMELAKVKSGYNQSVNQYELAEYNYENSVLYAPFSGVVANLFARQYNLPDASEQFCTIIDDSHLEADFKILESELYVVREGDAVSVSPYSINDYSCEGHISEINPTVDKNGMVRVRASIGASKGKLYDGMNIRLRLKRTMGKQLVIPKEALVLRDNKKVVFRFENGHAIWVYVETGLENAEGYVVTEGLKAGDSIIYEGNINLAHESPVKLKQ
jgi:RND family efflux transporter MFP subunit